MSPRTKEQYQKLRDEKIELIKRSALDLFANFGFENTSINKISTNANISKGLMYNYFNSKEDLLKVIMHEGLDSIVCFIDITENKTMTKEQFISYIDRIFDNLVKNSDYWKLYFSLMAQPKVFSLLQESFIEFITPMMNVFGGYFNNQGYKNPQNEVMFFTAMLDGIFMNYVNNPTLFDIDAIKQKVISMYS